MSKQNPRGLTVKVRFSHADESNSHILVELSRVVAKGYCWQKVSFCVCVSVTKVCPFLGHAKLPAC